MRILLDSHVLLWAVGDPGKLPRWVRDRLEAPDDEIYFSAASIWEIAIKAQWGQLDLGASPDDVATAAVSIGFVEVPVTSGHAAATARLPLHHRDPFDRLLVAQAIAENARLYTADATLSQYAGPVELIT